MVDAEQDSNTPAQKLEHKHIHLLFGPGQCLPLDMKLQHKYAVWAMVKNQQQAPPQVGTEAEKYISEN